MGTKEFNEEAHRQVPGSEFHSHGADNIGVY